MPTRPDGLVAARSPGSDGVVASLRARNTAAAPGRRRARRGGRHATGRTEIGALACCIALATSLANTTFMLFRLYWDAPQFWGLGQIFRFMLPIALPWTLVLVLLIHTTREVIWGAERNVNRGTEGNAQRGPYPAA